MSYHHNRRNHRQQQSPEQNVQVNHFALLALLDNRKYDKDHLSNLNEHLIVPISEAAWKARCDNFQRAYEASFSKGFKTHKAFLNEAFNGEWHGRDSRTPASIWARYGKR
jgi:hypothetical protein